VGSESIKLVLFLSFIALILDYLYLEFTTMEYVNPEGLRLDGRRFNEMRQIVAEVGVVSKADGSAVFEMGNTKVIAAVYGPREVLDYSVTHLSRLIL
jgi:hypothetical protein